MIDCIIKLGGSLLYDFEKTKKLLEEIYQDQNYRIAITVGSGMLGELYKGFISNLPDEIPFNDSLRDFSNIQSMNASVLTALNPNYIVCVNKQEVEEVLEKGQIPILDARGFMDVFKMDQYQKSDVRSAHLCKYLGCKNLIIITNVNGIYDKDPNKDSNARRIEKITSSNLKKMGRTAVDEGLAERIEDYDLTVYVLGVDQLIKSKGHINQELLKGGTEIERSKVYEKKN